MGFEERIKEEHGELRKMLELLNSTAIEDVDLRAETFGDLVLRLEAHERAEEGTIYEAMREDDDLRELALEAVEQHRIGRMLTNELGRTDPGDERWLPKFRAIKGLLESHLLIEEGLVIPTARDALGQRTMDRFEQEFEGRRKETLIKKGRPTAHRLAADRTQRLFPNAPW